MRAKLVLSRKYLDRTLIIKLVRILSRLPGHVMITPSKETTELVFENGSNSRGVSIPVNTQPFTNIASNSGEFPTARCTEWLKKRLRR